MDYVIATLLLALFAGTIQAEGPPPPAPPSFYGPPPAPASVYGFQPPVEDPGFTVQTGYEGYLVPKTPEPVSAFSRLGALGALGAAAGIITSLLPFPLNAIGLTIGANLGLIILGVVALLGIAGALTTAVCALTPICTITFLGLGFSRESTRQLLTSDRLTAVAEFVNKAIAKYKTMQKKSLKTKKAK